MTYKKDDLLNSFLEYLEKELNYSYKTIKNYKLDIESFNSFLNKEKIYFNKLSKEDIRIYLKNLDSQNLSNKTISRHLSSLRTYYNFLKEIEVVKENVFLSINNPKIEKKLPNYLSILETEDIINSFDNNNFFEIRNNLLIELIYSCGLRLEEVLNIKIKNINFSDKQIKISGKGNKERMVLFGEYAYDILKKYIDNYRKEFLTDTSFEYLFISKTGKKLSSSMAHKIIKNQSIKAGIKHGVSAHSLRHSFATDLLNNGASIETVKELLGHSSLSTTQIYTHVTNDKIKDTYNKAHPRCERKND